MAKAQPRVPYRDKNPTVNARPIPRLIELLVKTSLVDPLKPSKEFEETHDMKFQAKFQIPSAFSFEETEDLKPSL